MIKKEEKMKNKKLLLALVPMFVLVNSAYANVKELSFSTKVDAVCGIEITDAQGSIDFKNKTTNDTASFLVKTNSRFGYAKVEFTNIQKSENIRDENGYFKLNNTTDVDWNNAHEVNINHGETQNVIAKIDKDSGLITSGEASVTTTLEIECVDD